ncbi:MAG: HAD family phosphatase [Bacteroidales bacterium]|nr:HAD family phosphatase [Bacteroidales bacterium]
MPQINISDFSAVLFDLDGVIVDTEGQYSRFWKQIGEEYLPGVPDFAPAIKGRTLTQIYDTYFPDSADRAAITERLYAFERQMDFPYIAGVREFLETLQEQGVPTAIVTSSNCDKMVCLYACHPEIKNLVTAVLTAEDARRSKPAPDCYLAAAERLGVEIGKCLVFEDSPGGLAAGRASGAFVAGVCTSLAAAEIEPICDMYIEDFKGFI